MGEVCLKKILVLYKSKTGFSERYARWIAEDLQCDLANLAEFKKDSLLQYGLIIYGAGVYAGQINGILPGKRVAAVTAAHTPHKLAWYYGDKAAYAALLAGRTVGKASALGGMSCPAGTSNSASRSRLTTIWSPSVGTRPSCAMT